MRFTDFGTPSVIDGITLRCEFHHPLGEVIAKNLVRHNERSGLDAPPVFIL